MIYHGAIVIIYKNINDKIQFLLNENLKNGNYTLISGAKEEDDNSTFETAIREIKEELGLNISTNDLVLTNVKHEFVFGSNKPERKGQNGMYDVFLLNATCYKGNIKHIEENRKVIWMTKQNAFDKISFEDLKDVFKKATKKLN